MSAFLDEAIVTLQAGDGGNGAATFHREKYVPLGGPNGADGGKGGDIIIVADRHKRTLYDFRLKDSYQAQHGSKAVGNKAGKNGEDIVLQVPVGTVITDLDLEQPIVDLNQHGMKVVLCRGGKGGNGNLHYTTSVRQAPSFAQNGAPGELINAKLELKLIADVGLIGLPNAGKSTFLSAITAAKPKVGAYPFTTLAPNLGVVSQGEKTFVIADLPGLIEGASEGVGLGHQFLRHAERNKVLLHIVDAMPLDGSDPRANFELIEAELEKYSPELYARPRVVALNKTDIIPPEELAIAQELFDDIPYPLFCISGATNQGIEPLIYKLIEIIESQEGTDDSIRLVPVFKPATDSSWDVLAEEDHFVITGFRIEKLIAMTDLENPDAIQFLYRKLKRIGVINRLEELGAEDGDTVVVGDEEFTYKDW